jgi:hypothetical protein
MSYRKGVFFFQILYSSLSRRSLSSKELIVCEQMRVREWVDSGGMPESWRLLAVWRSVQRMLQKWSVHTLHLRGSNSGPKPFTKSYIRTWRRQYFRNDTSMLGRYSGVPSPLF